MGNANTKSYSAKVFLANTDTQVFTAPWRNFRRYFVNKIVITNESVTTNALVKFYDKDLSNVTPPVRGNSASDGTANPLLEFWVPFMAATTQGVSGTLRIGELDLPKEFFMSGMVANSNVANVVVTVEIKED